MLEIDGALHWALHYFENPPFTTFFNLHLTWIFKGLLTRAVDKLMSCWSFSLTATSTIVNRWPRSFPANEYPFKGLIRNTLWKKTVVPKIKWFWSYEVTNPIWTTCTFVICSTIDLNDTLIHSSFLLTILVWFLIQNGNTPTQQEDHLPRS